MLALVPLLVLDLVDAAEGVVGDIAFWIFFFATVAVLAASVVALAPRSTRTAGVRGLCTVAVAVGLWLLVNVVIL